LATPTLQSFLPRTYHNRIETFLNCNHRIKVAPQARLRGGSTSAAPLDFLSLLSEYFLNTLASLIEVGNPTAEHGLQGQSFFFRAVRGGVGRPSSGIAPIAWPSGLRAEYAFAGGYTIKKKYV
jgi:hypothetical protein